MKISHFLKLAGLSFILFSLHTSFAYAKNCPNFTGVYVDDKGDQLELKQVLCSHIAFISDTKKTELNLDGKLRQHEQGTQKISFVSAYLTLSKLNVEQLIQEKSLGQAPSMDHYTYKIIMAYEIVDQTHLLEKTRLYNNSGKLLDSSDIRLVRILNSRHF